MERDLTVGKPGTVLRRFCLPLFGSIIFQQLYNIADSLVAGRFIGENALAAVGNSYEITLIFIAFAFGCNIGCSVVVSTFFGAKQYRNMRTAVSTAFLASAVLCGVLMLVGIFGCEGLLGLIHTPSEVFADSKLYLDIYIWGLPFMFFYNIATGIFSAMGDSRTPFLFLAVSSCTNIAMDIWFVAGFHMGVAGVAWATFICQGASAVLAVLVVLKRLSAYRGGEGTTVFSWDILKKIAVVAIPSILQQSFISVGNIIIQSVINGFGPGVMAGYSAAVKLNNLVITSFTTLGNGISNYTAQNLGAGKPERIRAGFHAGLKLVWVISLPLVLLYFFAGKWCLMLFLNDPSTRAMDTGMIFLRILSPFYFIVSAKLVADGILRGASRMGKFMIATFTDLILRVVLAIVLSGTSLGSIGIWCAWPIGWTVATILSIIFYRAFDKKAADPFKPHEIRCDKVSCAEQKPVEEAVRQKYDMLTRRLIDTHTSITTMESCTAGLIASLITDREGASEILKGAFITYSNEAKILQGVPEEVLIRYGVYSAETAIAMAKACREAYGADIGIGVTGSFNNPDPNNADSNPGEVYYALARNGNEQAYRCIVPTQSTRLDYKLYVADAIADVLLKL